MTRRHWLFEIGVEELPYKTCQSVLAQLRGRGSAEAPGLVYEILAAERLVGANGSGDSGRGGKGEAAAKARAPAKATAATQSTPSPLPRPASR